MDLVHLPDSPPSFVGKLRDKIAAELPHVDPNTADPARAAEIAAAAEQTTLTRYADTLPQATSDAPQPHMAPNPAQGSSADHAPVEQRYDSVRASLQAKARQHLTD